jgi:hypothetical protein
VKEAFLTGPRQFLRSIRLPSASFFMILPSSHDAASDVFLRPASADLLLTTPLP